MSQFLFSSLRLVQSLTHKGMKMNHSAYCAISMLSASGFLFFEILLKRHFKLFCEDLSAELVFQLEGLEIKNLDVISLLIGNGELSQMK